MKTFLIYIFGVITGLFLIIQCSSVKIRDNVKFEGVNFIDTISQSDTMFFILKFDENKLKSFELRQYLGSNKTKSYVLHKFTFFKSGHINNINVSYKDTLIDSDFFYEKQSLKFDSLQNLEHYWLMNDFKLVNTNDPNWSFSNGKWERKMK